MVEPGAWAEENTRASLWDAMYRKETFGVSGPHIKVRFLATSSGPATPHRFRTKRQRWTYSGVAKFKSFTIIGAGNRNESRRKIAD